MLKSVLLAAVCSMLSVSALAQVSVELNIPLEQQYQRSTTTTVYGQGNFVYQERRQVPQRVCENRWVNGQITTFCTTQFVDVGDVDTVVPDTVYIPRVISTQPSVNGYPGLRYPPQAQVGPQAPRYQAPSIRIEIRK